MSFEVDTDRGVVGLVTHLPVPDLDHDRVDEDRRVDGLQRPGHPQGHLVNDAVGDPADRVLRHAGAVDLGEVGGVIIPYELFDTSAMQIKQESPFVRTFIVGYSYPSYSGYIPTEEGFANGGYEADNSNFAPGTAEAMVEGYLEMLNKMHE